MRFLLTLLSLFEFRRVKLALVRLASLPDVAFYKPFSKIKKLEMTDVTDSAQLSSNLSRSPPPARVLLLAVWTNLV